MPPERWKQAKDILSLALKRPSGERAAALDAACGENASLRREVEELLACHDEMGSFSAFRRRCEGRRRFEPRR